MCGTCKKELSRFSCEIVASRDYKSWGAYNVTMWYVTKVSGGGGA